MTESNESDLVMASAKAALSAVEADSARSWERGIYPQWFAIAYSLWAGALAATLATPIWLPLFFGGLAGYWRWRRDRPAWVSEVPTTKAAWFVWIAGLLIGGVFLLGFWLKVSQGWPWATWLSGIVVSVSVYSIAHRAYGAVWRRKGRH